MSLVFLSQTLLLRGVTIQAANERALAGGVTTDKIFTMVEEIREKVTIPMVFMTYANVLYSYGLERFLQRDVRKSAFRV